MFMPIRAPLWIISGSQPPPLQADRPAAGVYRIPVSTKRGGERHRTGQTQGRVGPRLEAARTASAEHQQTTKLELLREMVVLLAQWAGERTV